MCRVLYHSCVEFIINLCYRFLNEWLSSLAVSVILVRLLLWVLVINFAVLPTMTCRNQAAQPPRTTHQHKYHRGDGKKGQTNDGVPPCGIRRLA